MLLDICLGSKSAWRVLALYGESPGAGFTRQDLRKHTRLGNKALSFALKRLTSFGLLKKTKGELPLVVYKLNRENKYAENILMLLQKEREDLNHLPYDFSMIVREFSRGIIDSLDAVSIYLFGSVAKGTYRKDSDIDFAVVTREKNPKEDLLANEIADKLSKKFKRKLQCFLISKEQMETKKSDLVKEILKHGVRVV